MSKFVTALIATLIAGLIVSFSAVSASAHHRYHPGCHCGPSAPTVHYKTIHPSKFYTRYHDVSVYKRVQRIHRVVNVTRVQPIIHVYHVTRVHHHTIVNTRNVYEHVTQHLRPLYHEQHSVRHYYDCHCGR